MRGACAAMEIWMQRSFRAELRFLLSVVCVMRARNAHTNALTVLRKE
jgi:hypothetical protein